MFLIGLFTFPLAVSEVRGESIVVTNMNTDVGELDAKAARKIFLGKKKTWSSGKRIEVVTLRSGPVHEDFLENVLEMSPVRFRESWQMIIFTGTGKVPKTFDTERQVVDYIRENVKAIGYIDRATPHENLKEVPIVPKGGKKKDKK